MSQRNHPSRVGAFALVAVLALSLVPAPATAAIVTDGPPSRTASQVSSAARAIPPPSVTSPAAMISTIDGIPLWSRSGQSRRAVASTIKMLNALVVRERASLAETVVVSAKAAAIDDGDVGLTTGQRLTVRQLLDLMLIASANDAAEALAIHIGGTEASYVALMNAKARSLGLSATYAFDPHGLGKRERSSAQDLSVLARRVLADPVLRAVVKKQSVVVPRVGKKPVVLKSTYHLLGGYNGIEGVKTGYTRASGYCFVGAAKRGGVEVIGVVLGAKSNSDRFVQMRRLLDWGFAHTHVRGLVSLKTIVSVPVSEVQTPSLASIGTTFTLSARPTRAVSAALLDGWTVTRRLRAPSQVRLPITAGQRIGLLDLLLGRRLLATVPLVACDDVRSPATQAMRAIPR